MKLLTSNQARELDAKTIERLGLPGVTLMETAGRAVVARVVDRIGAQGRGRLVTVLCGTGNNGGDGFVVARLLALRGFKVHVYGVGSTDALKPDAQQHHRALVACGVKPRWSDAVPQGGELKGLHRSLLRSEVIVDALLGIGVTGELREPMRTWVAQLDGRHDGFTVAVDVPSGLDADTGRSCGAVAKVDEVVTFVAPKQGLLLCDGPAHWSQMTVAEIGVPPKWVDQVSPERRLLGDATFSALLPTRPKDGHKGVFGHLLLVAGAAGTSGAALLASRAALRAGVGVATLATAGEIRARIEGLLPDIMVQAVRGGAAEAQRIAKLVAGKSAAAVGPGLGTTAADMDLVGRICDACEGPVVLDADALSALAEKPELAKGVRGRLVLTPHPGEMARLMGCSIAEIQTDRLGAAQRLAQRHDAVILLKGARSLIAAPDGRWSVLNAPTDALSVAGSGDVLCGVVGALLAQGMAPYEAACAAAFAHNAAGLSLSRRRGGRGAMASDLIEALNDVWSEFC